MKSPLPRGHQVRVFRDPDNKPLMYEYKSPDGTQVVRGRKEWKRLVRATAEAKRAETLAARKRNR